MWLVCMIFVSKFDDITVGNTMLNIPYFYYDDHARSTFKYIWVRLKKADSDEYVEVQSTSKDWGRLDAFLAKYNPYGFVRLSCSSSDRLMTCKLVIIDSASYDFLDLIDSIELVPEGASVVKKAGRMFKETNLLVPLDDDMTLLAVQSNRLSIHGGFTLLHIVMHYQCNWLSDGNFYMSLGAGRRSIHRVNFVDMKKVRVFLAKATISYGGDPFDVNAKYLQLLGML